MTRTSAPTAISTRVCNLAAVALLAALGACGRDAVEPKLVGTWQTAVASPTGPYQLRFTTLSNGQYQTLAQGPAPVAAETGLLKAAGGKWRREKLNGGIDEGTYEFLSADSVLFKSKTETLLWSRVPNDVAAAPTQPPAASAGVAQSGLPAASTTAADAAQPSAELVAAGPFGAPLPQASATAPQEATTGSSFAGFAPSSPQPSASGANAPPQQATTAPASATGTPQPANMQHAKQAAAQATASAHQVTASAHQAVASAGEAADAVKAEADERIGPFRKAGSKIKNFFTGHKSDADNPDTSPAQQNGH
jgi:hypothetical protein